jgi:hypothetical protein
MAMLNNQRVNSVDSPNALHEPMETQRKTTSSANPGEKCEKDMVTNQLYIGSLNQTPPLYGPKKV